METTTSYKSISIPASVLILPMRNGNYLPTALKHVLCEFLSYLWGMETLLSARIPFHTCLVLILPMRNGNNTNMTYNDIVDIGSYPTYEEWKLKFNSSAVNPRFSSYPTYEEWKQKRIYFPYYFNSCVLILPMRNGNSSPQSILYMQTRFLSYLWGMETFSCFIKNILTYKSSYPTYEEWKLIISTGFSIFVAMFLSYLWGMETRYRRKLDVT